MGQDYGTGVHLVMSCRREGLVLFWIFTYLVLQDGGLVRYVIGELLECILKYLALHLRSNNLFTTNTSLLFLEQSLVGEILDRMVK